MSFRTFDVGVRKITAENIKEVLKKYEHYFDGNLKKVKIIRCDNGNCFAKLKIEKEHANPMNVLHGSFSAALVDNVTTFGLYTHRKCLMIPSVSVDLYLTYLKGAAVGQEITIDAQTVRVGNTLAYLKCEIMNSVTGDVLVRGSQTKYILRDKKFE